MTDRSDLFVEAVQRAASPLTHVQSGTAYPPFFIAKRGGADRLAVADAFAQALTNAGASVTP